MKLRHFVMLFTVVFLISCGGEEKKPASTTKTKKSAVKKTPETKVLSLIHI